MNDWTLVALATTLGAIVGLAVGLSLFWMLKRGDW